MKIAVSVQRPDIDSPVDPRFGRASYFLIVDSETLSWEIIENSTSMALAQGAGIQAAENVLRASPDVVLTGNCGPKAFRVLDSKGVKVCVGVSGKAREAVKAFIAGKYKPASGPNVEGHWA